MSNLLHRILATKKDDVERAKAARPLKELKKKVGDTDKPLPFLSAISSSRFGIIAEIKKKSPSRDGMDSKRVEEAPDAYRESRLVKAVSILTDWTYFGMTVEEIEQLKPRIKKPVLRKDFIFDEYQVWEARAFGADAILVMANLPTISKRQLQVLFDLASELGMEVLFEVHTEREIHRVPDKAKIIGINSRKFMTSQQSWRYSISRAFRRIGIGRDLTTHNDLFGKLINSLPKSVVKVAESGVTPNQISGVRDLGFNCALIGTSLLQSSNSITDTLTQFERALEGEESLSSLPAMAHAKV